MKRKELLLAALASGEQVSTFTPVKVQKLFFLLDREMAALTNGPHFNFQPYDYGPFDRQVYEVLEEMAREGAVQIDDSRSHRRFSLSAAGYAEGQAILARAPKPLRDYLHDVVGWLGKVSFTQLVSEVYRMYPDMRVNSIFRQ
jgi:uncharacterized protein